jgi:hypothetical protein
MKEILKISFFILDASTQFTSLNEYCVAALITPSQ